MNGAEAPKTTLFKKLNTGEDLNAKIERANLAWYGLGMSTEQVMWTTWLVDHESAGTWSPDVIGDNGCSKGIGQWNSCPGSDRHATDGFDAQVLQIGEEMLAKYKTFPIKTAIGKHNAPAWDYNAGYILKVESAGKNFVQK